MYRQESDTQQSLGAVYNVNITCLAVNLMYKFCVLVTLPCVYAYLFDFNYFSLYSSASCIRQLI